MEKETSPTIAEAVPRRRASSGERAAFLVRRMIFQGELRAGDRIPQDKVARALGISRIPVREALIGLEREGWVTIELHRGAFVNALDEQSVRDSYELFGLVYGFAARRALGRSGPELAKLLAGTKAAMAATEDPSELLRLASAFQAAVVDAAASPRIRVVLRSMAALVPGEFFALIPGAVAVEHRGLTQVLRAMSRGDEESAALAYQRMMRSVGGEVVKVFRQRGLFKPVGKGAGTGAGG